jgi:hypothetical protein
VPVIVERAKPQVSHTLFLQVNEVAYDFLNLRGVQNLLDDEFVDSFAHSRKIRVICKAVCARPTACVGSLPNARPPLGGQGHRTPQAGSRWFEVLYTFRCKKKIGLKF